MEVIAKCRYIRISAQKLRLVINMVRGVGVWKALDILTYTNKKSAFLVKKALKSAIFNAQNNKKVNTDNFKISSIFVDHGPSIKRTIPRAKGRSDRIIKRTSHLTIVISD